MKPLSLYELNHMVGEVLALSLDDNYWVVAEIAEMREAINGHCYLELVEKEGDNVAFGDDGNTLGMNNMGGAFGRNNFRQNARRNVFNNDAGTFRAKAKANIWRSAWARLCPKFQQQAGVRLSQGMKVLLQVKVTFHEQYGFSLNVLDIDPTYTLGDMARKRQEILEQLVADGTINDNKSLPLPRPLQRIAVISAAGAAGYGDFCKQLDESGFRFATKLFPASMQGSEVERTVIAALEKIDAEKDKWDCVVIIRGGGAVTDLSGFDTYLLAASVAQFSLPVFTGIGHERDDTVLDIVSHTRLKTPTAVAQLLIDKMREEMETVEELEERILNGILDLLQEDRQRFDNVARRFERAANNFTSLQRQHLLQLAVQMEVSINNQLVHSQHQLELYPSRMKNAASRIIEQQTNRLSLLEKSLKMAGPERILKMGYSITTDPDGNVIRSAKDIEPGTIIHTQLAEGSLTSQTLL